MKEVNEKYMKKIYLNILKAILIVFYFKEVNPNDINSKSSILYVKN